MELTNPRRGLLVILSSPSGAGKSTLARRLMDWDATLSPTNAAVAAGVAKIWKAEPTIKCEIIDLYTCGPDLTVVANINVVVNADLTLTVCDVIEFDASGRVTSLNAFLKKD